MAVRLGGGEGQFHPLGLALACAATVGVFWLGAHHGVETPETSPDPLAPATTTSEPPAYPDGEAYIEPGVAKIGANVVPPLHCQEDEVIWFWQHGPTPYHLACIPRDEL